MPSWFSFLLTKHRPHTPRTDACLCKAASCTRACTHKPYDLCFAHSGLHPPLTVHTSRMCGHEAQRPRVCRSLQRFVLLNTVFQISGFCPPLPRGLARLGAICPLCKDFGEMKVSLPRTEKKKGNESSWLGSFLHPFEPWWATPVGHRLDPGARLQDNSFCVWHVFSASQTHACEPQRGNTRESVWFSSTSSSVKWHQPKERKNSIFFIVTFQGQRHLLETLPQK